MFTDLSKINTEQFYLRPCVVAGQGCALVEPHGVGIAKWNRENLIYRSSIWTIEGELVSAGFPKFMNWDEDLDKEGKLVPERIPYPKPTNLYNTCIMEKLDGSLLIISHFKGEIVVRTRGTIDAATTLSNGDELAGLQDKYKALFDFVRQNAGVSLLCEWFSPRNKIVLNYGDEPKLWLVGGIYHSDYSLFTQSKLDTLAESFGIERPQRYRFDTIAELRETVEKLEGKEGVCVYYNDDQNILKLKSARYLALHYYKSDVSSIDKVVDLWLAQGRPDYQTFYNWLAETYDWEISEYARPEISKICDAQRKVDRIIQGFKDFIARESKGVERKTFFQRVAASYGGEKNNRVGMIMSLYSGKELSEDMVKKLIMQCIYE